jgi:pyruvyl transferase EpsO
MDLDALQNRLVAALAPQIEGRRVALLDFPNHTNCGDSAIVLGEERLFRTLSARVVHRSDHVNFREDALRRLPRDVVILLHGGGNMGDLWPAFQSLREQVIAGFPDRTIVQLPQSIEYRDEANAARMREVAGAHRDFHLLVRERRSQELATRLLGVEAALVPDMAFMLEPRTRTAAPVEDVLALCRTDKEATSAIAARAEAAGLPVVDWLHEPDAVTNRRRVTQERLARRAHWFNRIPVPAVSGALTRFAYEPLARMRLDYGLGLISRGRAVLTDRLHAHVMCSLLGIPSVAVDTGYGKIRGVHELWMADAPINRLAGSFEEALPLARELAG